MSTAEFKPVFSGVELTGEANVPVSLLADNVRSSIRRGHPQLYARPDNADRVCIVGGGPSLDETFDELRNLVFQGAKLVTLNGAYNWCLERNLRPSAQIIIDGQAHNRRFVEPEVPQCRYYLASRCHPEVWDAVEGRPHVGIWHDGGESGIPEILDQYYLGRWQGVSGGTTVGTRAIGLMRMLGYLRFDLFGFDSCWVDGKHHAYNQKENDADDRLILNISPTDKPELERTFRVSAWHVKQLEDLILFIRSSGDQFMLNIHGDGLLAFALRASVDVVTRIEGESEHGS